MPVFGFSVSLTFHLMFFHIIFSSVYVAEWPPFAFVSSSSLLLNGITRDLFVNLDDSLTSVDNQLNVFAPLQKLRMR